MLAQKGTFSDRISGFLLSWNLYGFMDTWSEAPNISKKHTEVNNFIIHQGRAGDEQPVEEQRTAANRTGLVC